MNYFHFASLPSTQDKAFELLESTAGPLVVSVDEQTKGRGRLQRPWIHEKENSLAMSLGFHVPAKNLSALSLVVGLGVVKELSALPLQLKWPNDLMLRDSKVGGILVESKILESQATVVVGIGINLQHLKTAPYSGIGNGIEYLISVKGVAETVWKYLCEFFKSDFSVFRSEYEKILWRRGQSVRFKIQESISEMKVIGVDASGALIVDRGGKISMQDSGEILFSGEQISEV